jgi:rhamnulokinase
MAASKRILAYDLGAESGRAILGQFDGERLTLEVLHRFPNGPVRTLDALHWDALRLFEEMKAGLRACVSKHGAPDCLGIDTWGVDFALLGRDGALLGNPRHYRDPHTENIYDYAFSRVPKEEIFRHTGIQFMRLNSLFQLLALQRAGSPILEHAAELLFIPDLFHYWLTGVRANEFTDASTSQFLNPVTRSWAYGLFDGFGLPRHILGKIIYPGTNLGPLHSSVANDAGASGVPVIVPATHDTGAAVAAVPAQSDSWCYLSSGTWSLMGIETAQPIIDDRTLRYNFTNEGGVGGTIRLLKNIMGLWLVQECKRVWERAGQNHSYDDLVRMAEQAPPLASLIDPDHESFLLPANMPDAIAEFCRRTGQPAPADAGPIVRCALESLALKYRWVFERLEDLHGKRLDVIHIVGGGSQNRLLNQLTADACDRPVLAGPVEATAIGNVLTQMLGLGLVGSLAEGREVVRCSFVVERYEPKDAGRWEEAWARFQKLLS